jgi:hypothetical protein
MDKSISGQEPRRSLDKYKKNERHRAKKSESQISSKHFSADPFVCFVTILISMCWGKFFYHPSEHEVVKDV